MVFGHRHVFPGIIYKNSIFFLGSSFFGYYKDVCDVFRSPTPPLSIHFALSEKYVSVDVGLGEG